MPQRRFLTCKIVLAKRDNMMCKRPIPIILLVITASISMSALSADALTIKDLLKKKQQIKISVQEETVFTPDNAMENYKRFIAGREAYDEMKREAILRLANLYLEKDSASDGRSGDYLTEAVGLYHDVLEHYPKHSGNAEVMYQLGSAYEQSQKYDKAVEQFARLNVLFPNYHPDEVAFRRGEILFNLDKFSQAEAAYQLAVKAGEKGIFYEKSLNKLGWSLFKEERYDDAIQVFFKLIDYKLEKIPKDKLFDGLAGLDIGEREVMGDTFRAVSLAFSYQDDMSGILEYIRKYSASQYEFLIFDELARFFVSKGRVADAVNIYKKFIAGNPFHQKTPYFQLKIISLYHKDDRIQRSIEEKKLFVKTYGSTAEYWQHFQGPVDDAIAEQKNVILKELARYAHAKAQQTAEPKWYLEAEQWYRSFLADFPKDSGAVDINFLLAELLYESKDFRQAIIEYEKTAYSYERSDRGGEAGYAALLAYDSLLVDFEQNSGESRLTWENAAIKSTLRFAKVYPRHEHTPRAITRAAEILYSLNEYARAKHLAAKIVQWHPIPEAELRYSAWNILGHVSFSEKEYAEAEQAYGSAVVLADEKSADSVVDVKERQAASIYKQGEALQRQGKLYEANNYYGRIVEIVTGTEINAVAIYDSAANWIELEEWDSALKALNVFQFAFPDHRLIGDVEEKVIYVYLQNGEHEKAISNLEQLAYSEADATDRSAIFSRISLIYEQAGDFDSAIKSHQQYLANASLSTDEEIVARYKLVKYYREKNEQTALLIQLNKIASLGDMFEIRSNTRARQIYAEAKYRLCEALYKSYLMVELSGDINASLKRKRQAMQEALQAYNKVIKLGSATWVTASTYRIAEIYNEFGQSLLSSQRPAGLTDLELEQYEVLLEEQSYPFEEKAIKAHQLNTQRAKDGIYDEWVKKSFARLRTLYPGRYGKYEKREGFVFAIK